MNLYLVEWIEEPDDYDVWLGFVVAANSVDEAHIQVGTGDPPQPGYGQSWAASRDEVLVTLIGTTDLHDKPTTILGSFKAG